MKLDRLKSLGAIVTSILHQSRVPGAAIAIVAGGETVYADGYGWRDANAGLPVTAHTAYPIASTTKAMNATVLGMLVDEGKLAWDAPVQGFLPQFRLSDAHISAQVTLRDLVVMRTGLPRHDWVWIEQSISRGELVHSLRHLKPSAGFRERFQYNNITTAVAGHVAEIVTGHTWEDLVQQRILTPLSMGSTGFSLPASSDVTVSYHENYDRELKVSPTFEAAVMAPAGTAIYSTVEDMAKWVQFNLSSGRVGRVSLIEANTLAEIHAPQIVARTDPSCPSPTATYGMGWFVDSYNGRARLSHGGYHHDVHSNVMLFPKDGVGCVCFTNFGCPRLADLINQTAYDLIMGFDPEQKLDDVLSIYEKKIEENYRRIAAVRRAEATTPSHSLDDYVGTYVNRAYGTVQVQRCGNDLAARRGNLTLPLQHCHYDAWVARDCGLFPIHVPHAFDGASRILFYTNADGEIAAVSIRLEPAVDPIRFDKL